MPEPRATIILVHGAWHGSWCWQYLTPHLQAQGLAVRLIELPSVNSSAAAGLVEDAQYLTAMLGRTAGPVILCGHSYGGMVISAAALAQADVRHLVYVCAYLTEADESVESSLLSAGQRRPGHWIRRLPDGRTCIDAERARTLFYHDCPVETQDLAVRQLRPQWGRTLSQACAEPAWRRYANTYVVCSADQALAPRIQREVYAPRANQVITLSSGHSPFLSQPLQLAQALVSRTQ